MTWQRAMTSAELDAAVQRILDSLEGGLLAPEDPPPCEFVRETISCIRRVGIGFGLGGSPGPAQSERSRQILVADVYRGNSGNRYFSKGPIYW